ncbi:hypothetical protein ACJQWK_03725 [Exserohilum turcicum]
MANPPTPSHPVSLVQSRIQKIDITLPYHVLRTPTPAHVAFPKPYSGLLLQSPHLPLRFFPAASPPPLQRIPCNAFASHAPAPQMTYIHGPSPTYIHSNLHLNSFT